MSRAPSRRGLLGSIAALSATGVALPLAALAAAPDAVLLALCDAYHRIDAEAETTADEALRDAMARRWAVSDQIETTPALTPAGKAAKARVALHLLRECGETPYSGTMERLVEVALAEAAGLPIPDAAEDRDDGRPALGPVAHPDAELLAACAAVDEVQGRMDALFRGPTMVEDERERDALLQPLAEEQEPFLEQVVELQARTLAGHVARARTLLGWDKDPWTDEDPYWNERCVGALLRDLASGMRV